MSQPESSDRKTMILTSLLIGGALLVYNACARDETHAADQAGSGSARDTAATPRPEPASPAPAHTPSPPSPDTPEKSQPAQSDCESRGLVTWIEQVDPETGSVTPRCGIPFDTAKVEDRNEANVAGRSRSLVIEPGHTREEIGDLLNWYYGQMRKELSGADRPSKQIFVYVYDSRKRVDAGLGEWQGMIQAIATDGEELPEQATPQFKLPPAGAAKPSAREEEIYDALMQEFVKRAGSEDESATMKRIARRYKITVAELDALHLKVHVYRNSGS